MPESLVPDLAHLTLANARAIVGLDFVVSAGCGIDVVLRLISAESSQLDPTAVANESGRPFSLLFGGPAQPQLAQGMRDLVHPEGTLRGIFLVPMGPHGDGCSYEAIFS